MSYGHSLNPVIEQFYLGILNYAGMEVRDGVIVNKNEKLGDLKINEKHLALPYLENLKNPDNRLIFHPLNENFTSPETSVFNLYKKRLTLELNLRLSSLIVSLISLASDVQLQQKVKKGELLSLVASLGEVDITTVEHFLAAMKASRKVNDEGFLFDLYLRKGGELNGQPYSAIGKVNFQMYTEIVRSLDTPGEYKVFGAKVRKKDLLTLHAIFNAVFPSIESPDAYSEGTETKGFRYLTVLLKTGYMISSRLNEIASMLKDLKEPSLAVEEIESDDSWTTELEKLFGMLQEIRLIPNQTDVVSEVRHMKLDESKGKETPVAQVQAVTQPQFDPARAQQQTQPVQQPQMMQQPMQPAVQAPPSAEDIIRGSMGYSAMPQPMMPQMMQPGMVMQPQMMQQPPMPMWMQQEIMRNNQQQMQQGVMVPHQQPQPTQMQQMPMQPQMMMQPQMQQMPMQPQMMMQPGMMVQPGMMMQQQMPPQQSGLQINPLFLQSSGAPWRM